MLVYFACTTEWVMYETRDLLGPQLRRAKVRYETQRCYPWECENFGFSIPDNGEYGMAFYIQLERGNPQCELVRQLAQSVAENLSGVLHLEIEE